MKRKNVAAIAFSVACLFAAVPVFAQPLADRVPADALVYVGWAGASTMGDAYGPSHLKAVLDDSHFHDLFGTYLDQVEAKVVKQEPKAAEAFRVVRKLGAPMWKYPTAMFVGKPNLDDPRHPQFHFAIASKAGSEANDLAAEINKLLADNKTSPRVKARAVADGDLVCFSIGYDASENPLADGGGLSRDAAFTDALTHVDKDAAFISYVNVQSLFQAIETASKDNGPGAEKFKTFLGASGLSGIKSYIASQGFDDKNWVGQTFVSAPGPRSGLLAATPEGAIDPSLMKSIPADATFVATSRFDAAAFVMQIREALGKTDADAQHNFNMGLSAVQQAIGVNPLTNLLEPMGSDWALYASPHVAGSGLLGTVLVNKLDDPEKFRKSLVTASVNLTNWINLAINKGTRNEEGLSVHGAMTRIGDVDVYYVAAPLIAPSWAVSDGRLYVGLFPQTVGAAARVASKGGPSIVDSEKYQNFMKSLAVKNPCATSYIDLPAVAGTNSMYEQLLVMTRYVGIGDLWGLTLPEPLMPPMDTLMANLSVAGSASWSDEQGFHKKSVTPFPGADFLSEQGSVTIAAAAIPLSVSILLPSLNRARETANRVKSASQLKQIGTACFLYANENRGKMPDNIEQIIRNEDITPDVFIDPRSQNQLPDGDADTQIKYVADHADYVYLGKGLKNDATAETVVAYEKPEGVEDGINILFGDGHVEFILMDQATQMIDQQKKDRGIE